MLKSSGAEQRPIPYFGGGVGKLMLSVAWALVPGLAIATWFFGVGVLLQITLCVCACVAAEAIALGLRGRSARAVFDGSAMLTGMLLGLSLPAIAPWWVAVFGGGFAIIIAKQLYGGLGDNPFNPAMAAYAALLISFPLEMTTWPAPQSGIHPAAALGQVQSIFGLSPIFDGLTGATALDTLKTELGLGRSVVQVRAGSRAFGALGGHGTEWVAAGFLIGGLWLLYRRAISWHTPIALLLSLSILAGFFYALDSTQHALPWFHLFSGATMLGAFFIATDPVTAAATPRGRLVFGAGIGVLTFVIRSFGGYPDGIAFAVLLMNMSVPLLDRWTQPRGMSRGR